MAEGTILADKLHSDWSLAGSEGGERAMDSEGSKREGCARRGKERKFRERVGHGRLCDSSLLSKRPTLSQHGLQTFLWQILPDSHTQRRQAPEP